MRHLLTVVFLLGASDVAMAQDADCENQQSQMEMNICSGRAADAADARLNALWDKVKRIVQESDRGLPDHIDKGWPALLAAQRAWIDYRNGQCTTERSFFGAGSIAPTVANSCVERMTKSRTRELQAMIEDF